MQLHACLLLFIITTDKTLALLHSNCGGNVSLDQEPAGHINLTSPGFFTDTSRLNSLNQPSAKTLQFPVCTWMIDIPPGRTVLLKLVWLESGSRVSVRCVLNEEDEVLESGRMALLSGCDRNKSTLTWTGAGRSSNAVQLAYSVQEDERHSSEDRSTHRPDQDLIHRSQTGTSFTRPAPVGKEVVGGTEGVRGHLYEGLEWSSAPQSVSSASSLDQGLLLPTSPQQGLPVAGRTDRETLPLPEEKPNNGADTSGAAHLTDGPMTARERTHPYFQHALSTDTESNTANPSKEITQTQMALTDATASSSNAWLGTDIHEYTFTQTSKDTEKPITMGTDQSVSNSSVLLPTSSPPELPSWTTMESGTTGVPRGGAVSGTPEDKQPHSWRSQQNTDRLNSDLTSTTTSDPLNTSTEPPSHGSSSAHTDTEPPSSTPSQAPSRARSSTAHITGLHTAIGTVEAASAHPNISQSDSFVSAASDGTAQTAEDTEIFHTSSSQSQRNSLQSTESLTHSPSTSSPFTQTSDEENQTATESTKRPAYMTTSTISSSPDITKDDAGTSGFTDSFSTPRAGVQNSGTSRETYTLHPTYTLLHDNTDSPTPASLLSSSTAIDSSTPSYMLQTDTVLPDRSRTTSTTSISESTTLTAFIDHKPTLVPSHTPQTRAHLPLPTSTVTSPPHKQSHNLVTTTQTSLLSHTTTTSDYGGGDGKAKVEDEVWQWSPSNTTTTAGSPQRPPPRTTLHPSQESHLAHTPSALTSTTTWSSTNAPKFYVVPDQPAAIRVESIELLLQMVVEESRSGFTAGLEEDAAAWLEPYLQRAPGFSRLLGVWSSGHAVQSLVEFKTSGALQWLNMAGPTSLLEQTALSQAVLEGRTFRSSKITNVTLGGLQGDVCDWLLQCPAGYRCVSQPGTANYSCSSVCRFDHCHHHGICTHHPGQLPVCRCLVGDDFWYMGQRCDVRMTRARLVGACLAILLIMVTVIGVSAFVAVRRYRSILIQAKVDQTRSSYRRFNHFDELSGRFWLRSWAGSADSLDNPAFTRSDELLHLRALDRPCCYHDDTLSLGSTCPSHGTHINTIYPHSSQYGWRGSEMSMGDGVLDSGKASDLSVCSWPVEPIHWTPFPLLQQLASHRTPTVRVSRPRSYCEGMELVDLGKSWTA
ncbi:serine-rich adhesin for platelets isoform X2 [Brachyistius frenatus]|uniref:serine-rich adhesin for platelets isoform X2 n=1 Tax=Brachyistius frenatus TaxID=100188 RepID=UPI0037E8969D